MTGSHSDLTLDPGEGALPGLPRDEEVPVFDEPWQVQEFAMVVKLHEGGHFTWADWAERLGAEVKRAQMEGDADLGDTYYDHWLGALEGLVADAGLIETMELRTHREAWKQAARATPHGQPIVLEE